MTQPTAVPPMDLEADRAAVRAELQSATAACRLLQLLLPVEQPWRGAASSVFRLRLDGVRERLDAAVAALCAAEAQL
jgi:hypothetical protein